MNTTGSRLEEVNIGGLTPDRTYYFRVLAYSVRGRGVSSDLLKVTTKPEVHVPGPPQKLKVIPTSPTSLLVQWSQPEQSSGAIQHYNMFYMEVRNGGNSELRGLANCIQAEEITKSIEQCSSSEADSHSSDPIHFLPFMKSEGS